MGTFKMVNIEKIKTYTLFSKNSLNKVLAVSNFAPQYGIQGEGKDVSIEIYLDSPNNLLISAGIILSKVIQDGRAYFKVEREEYLSEKKLLRTKEKKVFVHPIGLKDSASDHALFLIDGISSMFSTKFHIDLENVLKTVVIKLKIKNKRTCFKVLSRKGFKAEMVYEDVSIRNYDTRRKAKLLMLKIEQTSSKIGLNEFDDFTSSLEKYCKEIMPIVESKYDMAKRMTSAIGKK